IASKAMMRDLQAAADRGYRLVPLPSVSFLMLVQKSADATERVEYVFAWTGKDMDQKAALGYRLVNNFVMVRNKGITVRTHEYSEVATRLRQSMENELLVAARQGFRVVGLALQPIVGVRSFLTGVDDSEFVAIMERPVQPTGAAPPEYIVLSSLKAATMQTELQAAADRGYRLFDAAWGSTVLLEKTGHADPIDYLTLSTANTATMEREMAKASGEGFRFAATLGSGFREFVVVMQRPKGNRLRTHEQVLHAAARLGTLKREMLTRMEKGFRVVGLTYVSGFVRNPETVAILERPVQEDDREH
ncbi:MAG TPA: hypothetical protein VKH42_19615, partial [Vicinamibacterales bacterium]|nr:hypothetical protein [Vicinamibacterales bacterium]